MDTTVVPLSRPARHAEPIPDPITVIAWRDAVVEEAPGSMSTTSDEFLVWWANWLGPTAVLLARHLALYAADGESEWPLEELAGTFGVSESVIGRTVDRLRRFGIVTRHGSTVAVRLTVAPLTQRQIARLPAYLADAYTGL